MGVSHNWWFLWHGEEREEWLLQSHFCPALSQEDGLDWELQCIPPALSNQDPFGVGFHLLQSFGDRCRERECLTCVSVCTWLSKAGDGSLAMAQLVPGAAPSQSGASQSPRGASYKCSLEPVSPGQSVESSVCMGQPGCCSALPADTGCRERFEEISLLCMLSMILFQHYFHILPGAERAP